VALGAATEVERLRSAQIEQLQVQLTTAQSRGSGRNSSSASGAVASPAASSNDGSQLSIGNPIPANLADHNWVNAEYDGTDGLCCLGATSPTDSMFTPSLCPSNPPSRRHPSGLARNGRHDSCDSCDPRAAAGPAVARSPPKAKAKAGGLRVAIPGETISEAAAVLGGCHGAGRDEEQDGLEVVSGLISGIAARVADQAVASVQKERKHAAPPPPPPPRENSARAAEPAVAAATPAGASECTSKREHKGGKRVTVAKQPLTVDVDCAISTDNVGVTVTPMGKLRQTCTPNSRYCSSGGSGATTAGAVQAVEG
jgi:hypothetical protein